MGGILPHLKGLPLGVGGCDLEVNLVTSTLSVALAYRFATRWHILVSLSEVTR